MCVGLDMCVYRQTCVSQICVWTHRWGQWRDVLRACDFRKRQLGVGDVENISRTIVGLRHIVL